MLILFLGVSQAGWEPELFPRCDLINPTPFFSAVLGIRGQILDLIKIRFCIICALGGTQNPVMFDHNGMDNTWQSILIRLFFGVVLFVSV